MALARLHQGCSGAAASAEILPFPACPEHACERDDGGLSRRLEASGKTTDALAAKGDANVQRQLLRFTLRQGAVALRLTRDVLTCSRVSKRTEAASAIVALAVGLASIADTLDADARLCAQRVEGVMGMLEWVASPENRPAFRPSRLGPRRPEMSTAADIIEDTRIWLLIASHAAGPIEAARAIARDSLRVAARALGVAARLVDSSDEASEIVVLRPVALAPARHLSVSDAVGRIEERLAVLADRIDTTDGGPPAFTSC
jgi:hypothetical protein